MKSIHSYTVRMALALPLVALAVPPALVACSGSNDTPGPGTTSTTDGGGAPKADGGVVANPDGGATAIITTTSAPVCTGVPTSCCYATQKYGGRAGADTTCGPGGNEDCCKYDDIPAGTFNRMNDATLSATMPGFKLGRYLVTTSRFNVWLQEGGGLQSAAPAPGAGANPAIPGTGWNPAWNSNLSDTTTTLDAKIHKTPGADGWGCTIDYYPDSPYYPMSCVDWYQAQAFCAWDGGYAITESQWEYASRGGSDQRKYAWGSTEPTSLDYSVFCVEGGGTWGVDAWCNNPTNLVPQNVGSSTKGQGKWGTYDLMGDLLNITIDDQGAMPATCTGDCVNRADADGGAPAARAVARGIAFSYPNNLSPSAYTDMMTGRPVTMRKTFNGANFGFRCAYPNEWPASAK